MLDLENDNLDQIFCKERKTGCYHSVISVVFNLAWPHETIPELDQV